MNPADPVSSRLERARACTASLRAQFKTIILGTASPAGEPEASVAAAVLSSDGSFHIFVSRLAVHTRQLLDTGRASVLLAEDEAISPQPLARRRLTFTCTAQGIARDHPDYPTALQALREKIGPAFDLLTGLGDFELIRLCPQRGRLVAGFGEAYEVDPQDWTRLSPVGRPRP